MGSILKTGSTWRGIATRLARWGAFVTLAPWAVWAAPPSAIVIGQSLPISGPMTFFSREVISGAQAYVGHINATGGIQGRPVQLITLDDGGDPARHEANLRSLARDSKAIAFLNCVGDASCLRAAKVATELDVPLVGPMSGLRALRKAPHQQVIAVRAGYDKEATALSLQMRSMGFSRVTLLTDSPGNAEHLTELRTAFERQAIRLTTLSVASGNLAQLQAAIQGMPASNPQTLLFDLNASSLDELATVAPELRATLPRMLTSMATPSMTNLLALFRENVIGFTTVVPNPEIQSTPLVRQFGEHSSRYGSGTGMFEGLEAYISTRICLDALRHAGAQATAQTLTGAIWQLGRRDLGGFAVVVDRDRPSASDWVEVAVRSRAGYVLK